MSKFLVTDPITREEVDDLSKLDVGVHDRARIRKTLAALDEARLALALMRRTLELIADGEGNPDLLARRTLHTLREGAWEDKP